MSGRGILRRERLYALAVEFFWFGAAYLLGSARTFFGTTPLGFGLLCASPGHTLSILLGLILSAVSDLREPVVYICTYAAAALIRLVSGLVLDDPNTHVELPEAIRRKLGLSDGEGETDRQNKAFPRHKPNGYAPRETRVLRDLRAVFSQSVCLRMCTAAICAFAVALYRVISGGFRYYDLFGALFVLLVAPLSVALWSISLEGRIENRFLLRFSQGALSTVIVWAARDLLVSSFSLSVILATVFTLYACASYGAPLGCVGAVLFGIAHAPLYAPSFLLAALIYSFGRQSGRESGGTALAALSMSVWALYAGGISALLTFLPAGLIGGAVFGLLQRLRGESTDEKAAEEPSCDWMEKDRYKDSNERFRGISEAFSSLSEVFYNLSDRFRRPGTLDLRRICDSSFDEFCQDCPNKTLCWGLEYPNTLSTVNGLISRLHTRGKVERAQIPEPLLRRCDSMDLILDRINRDCARLTGEMLKNNRTEIFAMDYEAAARIINDALEEDDGEYRCDEELEKQIAEYLRDAGIRMGGVTVYGNRRRRIMIRDANVEEAKVTVETLRSDLGELCGLELSQPTFEVEGKVNTMTLQARKRIRVLGAQNNVSADGGVSGDCINLFSNKKDYFYALINDGMGSGKEAAFTSGLCSVFLEKMLRAGNRASTSLRMLNNLICSKESDSTRECSSTVDLMELDLMTARASFIKSGAAPSFVVRDQMVHRLQIGTAPIGILPSVQTQAAVYDLRPGDTVVMVSDGILQDDPECRWFSEYLKGISHMTPEEIVYGICLRAAENESRDDCSVIALRILPAEEEAA